jgi:hypothetical protein
MLASTLNASTASQRHALRVGDMDGPLVPLPAWQLTQSPQIVNLFIGSAFDDLEH